MADAADKRQLLAGEKTASGIASSPTIVTHTPAPDKPPQAPHQDELEVSEPSEPDLSKPAVLVPPPEREPEAGAEAGSVLAALDTTEADGQHGILTDASQPDSLTATSSKQLTASQRVASTNTEAAASHASVKTEAGGVATPEQEGTHSAVEGPMEGPMDAQTNNMTQQATQPSMQDAGGCLNDSAAGETEAESDTEGAAAPAGPPQSQVLSPSPSQQSRIPDQQQSQRPVRPPLAAVQEAATPRRAPLPLKAVPQHAKQAEGRYPTHMPAVSLLCAN